jgi:uncharacterized membrane protein YadS
VASHRLLRAAVVLLGFQLSTSTVRAIGPGGALLVLVTVGVTFTGMLALGRLLGLPSARALLLASGYSICGASAVAAVRHAVDADEDDVAVAVALVTLCGSLAIFVLPALGGPLGLDPVQFGSWVGASVHDVGQTVATAQAVPGALTVALVIKLSRVALLLPLVTALGVRARRRATTPLAATAPVASEEQCPGTPTSSDATGVAGVHAATAGSVASTEAAAFTNPWLDAYSATLGSSSCRSPACPRSCRTASTMCIQPQV